MPRDLGDGWAVGHLADHGFDVGTVEGFMEQIRSGCWFGIDASASEHVPLTGWSYVTGYGYQWWLGKFQVLTRTLPYYSTQGYGGQLIFVIPELALVVAFTGSNYENGHFHAAYDLMDRHVLPDAMGCEIPAGAFGPTSCP